MDNARFPLFSLSPYQFSPRLTFLGKAFLVVGPFLFAGVRLSGVCDPRGREDQRPA